MGDSSQAANAAVDAIEPAAAAGRAAPETGPEFRQRCQELLLTMLASGWAPAGLTLRKLMNIA